jgi:type VI secretion system ImpB/VipA family protein
MEEIAPTVEMDVPNVLGGQGAGQLHVHITFSALDQFDPVSVARNTPELLAALRKRERLNEWRTKLANKPKLAAELRRYLKHRNRPSPNGAAKKKES